MIEKITLKDKTEKGLTDWVGSLVRTVPGEQQDLQ